MLFFQQVVVYNNTSMNRPSCMRPSHCETSPYKQPKTLNNCNFRDKINETEKDNKQF